MPSSHSSRMLLIRSCLRLLTHNITDNIEKAFPWKDSSWKVRLWHMIQPYLTLENPDERRHNEQANFTQTSFFISQGKLGLISFIASTVSCEALHSVCRGSEVKAFLQLSEILSWVTIPNFVWKMEIICSVYYVVTAILYGNFGH